MAEPTSTPRPNPDPTLAYEPPTHGSAAPSLPPVTPPPAAYEPPYQPSYQASYQPDYPAPHQAPQQASYPGSVTGTDVNWAVGAHLSGFAAAYLALGFLGPLVVMLTAGRRSPFVRRHAVEALNFNLTVLLALAVSGVLVVVLVGLLMLPLVGIAYVVFTVMGAIAASRGQEFRYPLTIRFVR